MMFETDTAMDRAYSEDMRCAQACRDAVVALTNLLEHDRIRGTLKDDACKLIERLSEQQAHIVAVWD